MNARTTIFRNSRIVREWRCHGKVWTKVVGFDDKRDKFKPICPKCGSIGRSFSEATADGKSSHVRVD